MNNRRTIISHNFDDENLEVSYSLPTDEKGYRSRFIEYDREKEDRKTEFLKKSIEGFENARKMYYRAMKQIYFTTLGFDFVKGFFPDYTKESHNANLKKVLISLRKTAETCYFLDRNREGMLLCDEIIKIVASESSISLKMLKLTLSVMGRFRVVQKKYNEAKPFIRLGIFLDPPSGILKKTEEYLEKAMEEDDEDEIDVSRSPIIHTVPEFEERTIEQILKEIQNLVVSRVDYKNWKIRFEFFSIVQKLRPHLRLLHFGVDSKEIKQSEEDLRNRVGYLTQSDHDGFVSDPNNQEYLKMIKFNKQSLTFYALRILF